MALPIAILIFVFIFILLFGVHLVITGLRKFAQATHTGVFVLSAVLLSVATSLPELFIAFTSGITRNSSLSLGNILGANITNITLVAGGAALLAGAAKVQPVILKREVIATFVAGLAPLILAADGTLSRLDGILLIAAWILYVIHFFHIRLVPMAHHIRDKGLWHRFLETSKIGHTTGKAGLQLVLGIIIMLVASQAVVQLAYTLTKISALPLVLVGAIVLAIGTTLPELAFSYKSLTSGEPLIFLGNLLGSIIVNSTLVIGTAALFSPAVLAMQNTIKFGVSFVMAFSLFWLFIHSKHRLDRGEAMVLLVVYILFVLILTA